MQCATEAFPAQKKRSRLRVVCPAYPAINIYSRVAKRMTALGPVCLATAVQDVPGWDAEVVDENNYRRGPVDDDGRPDHEALQEVRPADIVGLYGGLTSTVPRLFEIVRRYKALGTFVIAGGIHFGDWNAEEALRNGVDILVLGEGEKTIVELLTCLGSGGDLSEIRGIAFLKDGQVVRTPPREPITDFDALPLPDFSVLRYAKMEYYPVSGVRGCGMDCEFCSVKGKPRFSSADRMMEQFATIYEKWRGKVFFVVDDLFGQNRKETLRLCRMLRDYQDRHRVKFSIVVQIRLDRARDAELLQAMREARINYLAVGFESPIAEELKAMDKRLKPEEMVDLALTYRRAGFRIHAMFIFGYPAPEGSPFQMSAEERADRFSDFIRRAKLDTIQVLHPIPILGTALHERLKKQSRIYPTELVGLEYYDGNFPIFEPDPPMTAEANQAAIHKIMRRFYGPRHLAAMAIHLLMIPMVALWLYDLRTGWQAWYRRWRGIVHRCGGWLMLREWTSAFKKNRFLAKLAEAKRLTAGRVASGGFGGRRFPSAP